MQSSETTPVRRGIPLTSLFLLLTACGMLAGAVGVALRHQPESAESNVLATFCAVLVPLITFVSGILLGLWFRGTGCLSALLGGVAGAAVGLTQAIVGLAPSSAVPELLVVLIASSAMMLLIGVVGRFRTTARAGESNQTAN